MNRLLALISNFAGRPLPQKKQWLMLLLMVAFVSACATSRVSEKQKEDAGLVAAKSNTSLGLEYMNRGQFEVALGKLKKAIQADPNYAPAHTVIGVLYERIGELALAGKHYKNAYNADPEDGDVNNNYAVYLCKTGNDKQADEHFSKALSDPFYSSPAVALTNAGSCAMSRGKLDEANDYLRRALKLEPGFPDALISMARLNFERQSYLNARAFMQRYEAVAEQTAASLLLAYKIETASADSKSANSYKRILESNFPDSDQAAEVRRMSAQ